MARRAELRAELQAGACLCAGMGEIGAPVAAGSSSTAVRSSPPSPSRTTCKPTCACGPGRRDRRSTMVAPPLSPGCTLASTANAALVVTLAVPVMFWRRQPCNAAPRLRQCTVTPTPRHQQLDSVRGLHHAHTGVARAPRSTPATLQPASECALLTRRLGIPGACCLADHSIPERLSPRLAEARPPGRVFDLLSAQQQSRAGLRRACRQQPST